ncbi:N-acetylmuramoyl-L-alanine amidase [Pseudoflavonifractor phocaeensis]|uniref:N-acetylmuramoyl-L-alanine amidase n=1 Tax=Pseudoflavonifractor phocaeensis TaxID=1870988 RepID=UPI00210BFAC5|nr:N-acetylmuramoyl-L-alanine amidase [Pseudoflavonifractor phocaeensis]MCQ4864199.1 N-acetylmuramoyl-L-alanine amidase [Pseudoflavonifractor phocaeensis]
MKKDLRMKILSWALVAALALGTGYFLWSGRAGGVQTLAAARFPEETVVIDAGHGGEDGGAVSISGVPESGINLAVALRLDQLFGLYGVRTEVLRTEDVSLHDSGAATMRERKVSDIHNRVERINAIENATLISIHQNTYPTAKYHGAQVFYSNGELSMALAQLTQETLRLSLDPDNNRVSTKIPDTVYLMNHISCRAILVECGFLSNPEEDQLLQSKGYQTKLATALCGAYLRFQDLYTKGELPNEGESSVFLYPMRE